MHQPSGIDQLFLTGEEDSLCNAIRKGGLFHGKKSDLEKVL